MTQPDPPVYVTLGGNEYLTLTITDRDGLSLAASVITVALTRSAGNNNVRPATWLATADVPVVGAPVSQRTVRVLLSSSVLPTAGSYDVWVRTADSPESPIRRQRNAVVAA